MSITLGSTSVELLATDESSNISIQGIPWVSAFIRWERDFRLLNIIVSKLIHAQQTQLSSLSAGHPLTNWKPTAKTMICKHTNKKPMSESKKKVLNYQISQLGIGETPLSSGRGASC